MKKYFLIYFSFALALSSCVDDEMYHPVKGRYWTEKSYTYYDNNGNYSNTTTQIFLDVELKEDSISFLGGNIHEDNFEYGKTYSFLAGFNYFYFRFEPDSVYATIHYGSSGANSTTHYRGSKLD
tara:strand:+ start:74906 stop:75277 length:372 start_codon:yes stop_codon:yes gene_type:complete